MPSEYVPAEHEIIRYVKHANLRRDENDVVLGVLAAAFKLRPGEEYLSATWVDYFRVCVRFGRITGAVRAIRNSALKVTPKSGFAVGLVADIQRGCKEHGHRPRFIHEATPDNKAHVAVRLWSYENQDLLELMADELWAEWYLNAEVP